MQKLLLDAFIQQEQEDYKIGKRHLANMMGEDPEHFTQADVEVSYHHVIIHSRFIGCSRLFNRCLLAFL